MSILVNEFESQVLLQSPDLSTLGGITLAGTLKNSPGWGHRRFRVLGNYALVLVVDGGGVYQDANGLKLEVVTGDMLLIFPELGHWYGPRSKSLWSEIYAVFEGPIFETLRAAGVLRPSAPKVHLDDLYDGNRRLRAILEMEGEVQVAHLAAFLTELLAETPELASESSLARARALLDANLESEPDWQAVAAESGWAYETFRKRFGEVYGLTPARYRFQRRIEAAKSLLRDTRLANKEIAAMLGFADEFHFSKRFKQAEGCSPRHFRSKP